MTDTMFSTGQRWVSTTESELGLGVVQEVANRRVVMHFPAAGEHRTYAKDNAPLSRVEYQPGQQVNDDQGRSLTIDAVTKKNSCFFYRATSHDGEEVVLPEMQLDSFVQFSKPQDRLFAGQIDGNSAFRLRYRTMKELRSQQRSGVRGLLGPRVQLLPHQFYIASETAGRYAPRVLLADEVGLGKTIEAGLILHQQLLTGRASRALIVVPDSLLHQWLVEMLRRFNLQFTILDEARCDALEERHDDDEPLFEDIPVEPESVSPEPEFNPFDSAQLILCTLSFLSGNRRRHEQAMSADWDLLVVDEAHHLEWSERQASPEYRCIEALAGISRGLLLLTATPEQLGVDGHFARLRLLDPDRYFDLQAFLDEAATHRPLNDLVESLSSPGVASRLRRGELVDQIRGYMGEEPVNALLEAAGDEHGTFLELLDLLIGDLLDRHGTGRVLFRNTRASVKGFPGRELQPHPLTAPKAYRQGLTVASLDELLTPEVLLGDQWLVLDPRVSWLETWLAEHRREKVLIICARATTAIQLEEHLRLRSGTLTAAFHEDMTLITRDRAAAYFADSETGAQALVCSEIGSEGRNFQFAHHLVMFDLPLNPDLLEQRIGRLDRIGQRLPVQVHVPHYELSAMSVLLDWYHDGIDAFEHNSPAGSMLFQHFGDDLRQCLQAPDDTSAFEDLLTRTRQRSVETLEALQHGRDHLIELNSYNEQRAKDTLNMLVEQERRHELSAYMEQVFDEFGVEQEHHSSHSLVIRPGDHMQVHDFPALPEDGVTATWQRELALSREDMQFLTWEHPMVTGAMDMVLSGELGNTAFCTLRLPPLKAGTILLEAVFTLACTAPSELQLTRFLPVTPVRVVVDSKLIDLSGILSHRHFNRLGRKAPIGSARELVRHTRPKVTAMITRAEEIAGAQRDGLVEEAVREMQTLQQHELERLRALAIVNPNIREDEIRHLEMLENRLQHYLEAAQLKLDAIRVAMVSA